MYMYVCCVMCVQPSTRVRVEWRMMRHVRRELRFSSILYSNWVTLGVRALQGVNCVPAGAIAKSVSRVLMATKVVCVPTTVSLVLYSLLSWEQEYHFYPKFVKQ